MKIIPKIKFYIFSKDKTNNVSQRAKNGIHELDRDTVCFSYSKNAENSHVIASKTKSKSKQDEINIKKKKIFGSDINVDKINKKYALSDKQFEQLTYLDAEFIGENMKNNPYYNEKEYIETFLFFKNLTAKDGSGVLNMGEYAKKAGTKQETINKRFYKNMKQIMQIDPSSVNASYLQTMVELIQKGVVSASALRIFESVANLKPFLIIDDLDDPRPIQSGDKWSFSSELKSDIDKMYDVIAKNKDKTKLSSELYEAFIPSVKNDMEGLKKVNTGETYQVEGEDKIRIKTADDKSELLDISKKTYYKLFPPVERFASAQQVLGDCYCIESMMLLYSQSDTRVDLLQMFHEDSNGNISIKFPNAYKEVVFEDGKFPQNQMEQNYSSGAEGFKMLEYAYAQKLFADEIKKAISTMTNEEFLDFRRFVCENGNNTFVYQDENNKTHYMKYDEARKDKSLVHKVLGKRVDLSSTGKAYPTYSQTLLGNGGTNYAVLSTLGYIPKFYASFDFGELTNEEIGSLIAQIEANESSDIKTRREQIEFYNDYKDYKNNEETMKKQMEDTIRNNWVNGGVPADKINLLDEKIIAKIKNPDFYKKHIVQLGIAKHVYGLTCEKNEKTGNAVYYLYNPYSQGLPIEINDADAFFNKKDLFRVITVIDRKNINS